MVISFTSPNPKGLTPEAQEFLKSLVEGLKMEMPDKDTLVVHYPKDLVKQVRVVNVDDTIFRLDFVDHKDYRWCVFPNVPWNNRKFFFNRFKYGRRKEDPDGTITLIF